jgi:hypothetical protein
VGTAWAQTVSDIAIIQVHISAPDLSVPSTATVSTTNPTSGQVIPVTIQAPVGQNRTIAVAALNAAGERIYSGRISGVNLTAGSPTDLEITLARTFSLTIQKEGSGTVTSSPAGINCGSSCSVRFDADTAVTLTPAPAPGFVFSGWSGACSGTDACVVDMNGNKTVGVTFDPTPPGMSTLTVTSNGTGTGTVSSAPAGINNCSAACSANFPSGTSVTLTAAATGGSTFGGWTGGGCSGTELTCVVAMTGPQTVTATFNAPPLPSMATLTVNKAGAGAGTVSSEPPGIDNCAATCSFSFPVGTNVTLTANPTGGSTFAGWTGCSGAGPTCSVVMDISRTVTATFNPPPSPAVLTVNKTGTGTGTVTSDPAGIDCGNTCSAGFGQNSSVTLNAVPDSGSTFVGWSGGPCSGTGACTIMMNTDQTVVATFDLSPTLTIDKTGVGFGGTVTSTPPGIDCGIACSSSFATGTSVTLTATPFLGFTFVGWSGAACSGTDVCVVDLVQNETVTATFDIGIQ